MRSSLCELLEKIGSHLATGLARHPEPIRPAWVNASVFTGAGVAAWLAYVLLVAAFNVPDTATIMVRLEGRIIQQGFYGLRPLAWIVAGWCLFYAVDSLMRQASQTEATPGWYRNLFRVEVVLCSVWIFWNFVRVAAFYYMRIDVDLELAVYALLELRALILSEVIVTLGHIPIYIPLVFSLLLLIAPALGWRFPRQSAPGSESHGTLLWRPIIGGTVAGVAALTMAATLPPLGAGDANALREIDSPMSQTMDGPGPFPPPHQIAPQLYEQKRFFRERFGFNLPEGTNLVFIILESAREAFVDLESSRYFAAGAETLRVKNFFVPVPHSSNSHFSLFTGLHSKRDFEEKYEHMRAETSLPRQLEQRGYQSYYIYTDHTSFESERLMLRKLGMEITEKRDFEKRLNPESGQPYISFPFGMDDIALLHGAIEILDNPNRRHGPFTMSVVMTNSHYPYLNPHPEKFNKHNDKTITGRHRNGVDYGLHIADRIVDAFRQRGLDRKTLFVLMSDHGESFGERGFFRHSFSIYNEEIRVPIVLRHPSFARLSHRGDRDIERGSMLDVYPTIFDMLGLDYSAALHGRSLFDPRYEFRLPLWVWRLDDYRGLLYGDDKYVYNTVDDELLRLDLHDKVQEKWTTIGGHAREFVTTLTALDFGKAGGIAVAAGDRRGPFINPGGKFVFGGSFKAGGGRFYYNCAEVPRHLDCQAESEQPDAVTMTPDPATPLAPTPSEQRQRYPELLP